MLLFRLHHDCFLDNFFLSGLESHVAVSQDGIDSRPVARAEVRVGQEEVVVVVGGAPSPT